MDAVRIDKSSLQQFAYEVLTSAGVDDQEALVIAEVFVWADLVGRPTQGTRRLCVYLRKHHHGLITSPCDAQFLERSDTVCVVDGRSGFGQYLGHIAMDRAVAIAKEHGIGLVGVRRSNHFGAAGYYVEMAAERGLIGLACSNSVPHVAAYGGVSAVLGTNPFAFGAPTRDGRSVLVDFSTGASSGSVIMKAAKAGGTIPEGIVVDLHGDPVVDAKKAVDGVILPFGGAKGFGLGLMVEIMSAVVTGAGVSSEVASLHRDLERESNVGHCFIAIDISRLMPLDLYYDRMNMLIGFIKESKPQRGVEEVLVPGETRWRIAERQLAEGIYLDAEAIKVMESMARDWGISTPW